MESLQIDRLTALGHAGRIALFRLLVRRYPAFLAAGELADILDVKKSTMSVYLSALMRAGLLEQRREGRSLLYRADMAGAEDLVAFLFGDCCRGRPEICLPGAGMAPGAAPAVLARRLNVLFLCTGNSARSIMAEALLRDIGAGRFAAFSAGTRPAAAPHPEALAQLRRAGHDISALRSKDLAEFQAEAAPAMDFVFTLCDQAANEECAFWPGQPFTAHWGLPDPAAVKGSAEDLQQAFARAYRLLHDRITRLVALQPEKLDRKALQAQLDAIGQEGQASDAKP